MEKLLNSDWLRLREFIFFFNCSFLFLILIGLSRRSRPLEKNFFFWVGGGGGGRALDHQKGTLQAAKAQVCRAILGNLPPGNFEILT